MNVTFGHWTNIAGSGTISLLVVDCLTSRPGHDALFPAILAIFAIYTLLTLPFYVVLGGTVILSVIQTCAFVLFVLPIKTNELLLMFPQTSANIPAILAGRATNLNGERPRC
ncbi:hypothetical protein OESDEN_01081 [Oesophagostomum dentatum]|uniref:Uncharacterized protein n=1 Tax=Oesophagostomum dentatum TaxID=61180 RepID=A0A0B1TU12_OESDE|nr:hypothetical protein OESDEN_01081 [Oesophagostomum dentatum]